jgi:RNA polymerase sigma-70 factor (ECF subfamily)
MIRARLSHLERPISRAPGLAPGFGAPLLDTARAGDHFDRLYRAALALTRSAHEADDLVQDTYARVLSRPRRLRSQSDVGYLLVALRHTFIDARRRRRAEPVPLDEVSAEIADASTWRHPEQAVAANEVYAAIAALPDNQREVVAAVDVAGLSYREAAEVLGVPIGTVMSRLYRARDQLAAQCTGCPA